MKYSEHQTLVTQKPHDYFTKGLDQSIPNQRAPFDPHIAGQQANTWRAATDLTNRHQCVPLTPSENNPDVHCKV